jgi:signal transduction histidine kinase
MSVISRTPEPPGIESALSPALSALGDPARFGELFDTNPAGVVLVEVSPELRVAYCNEAFRRWAPMHRRPLVGRPVTDLFAWSDRSAIQSAYGEVVRTGLPLHWRSAPYHDRPGGPGEHLAYWNVSHYPLRDASGTLTHVLSFTIDVTDQAGARFRMRDAQQRVLSAVGCIARHLSGPADVREFFGGLSRALLEVVPAGRAAFWLLDGETISPQAGAVGFSRRDLDRLRRLACRDEGDGLMDRVVHHDVVVRDDLDRVAAGGDPLRGVGIADTITIPWQVGDRRLGAVAVYDSTRDSGFSEEDEWVLQAAATAAALVWEHREADATVAALREREAAAQRQQVAQSTELEQLKTDFLKLASHELRGPLGVVRGYVSMMEDGTLEPVGEGVAPVLPVLRAKLDEMSQLIDEMLETARLDDSALQLRLERMDLGELVRESVRSMEPLAGPGHRLVVETGETPLEVTGDRSRLSMIVTNLVHNAIKYSPEGGEVRATCRATGDAAVVAVTDHGIGIAPEHLGTLFTRFGRIETPETEGIGGTGLGLYLARDLARRHAGDLTVASEPGRGSTFTLTIPRASRSHRR